MPVMEGMEVSPVALVGLGLLAVLVLVFPELIIVVPEVVIILAASFRVAKDLVGFTNVGEAGVIGVIVLSGVILRVVSQGKVLVGALNPSRAGGVFDTQGFIVVQGSLSVIVFIITLLTLVAIEALLTVLASLVTLVKFLLGILLSLLSLKTSLEILLACL